MPTSGAAIMQNGETLYLAKKEQCLALGINFVPYLKSYTRFTVSSQIVKYSIYIQDGVFPEKVNEGRVGVGNVGYSIEKSKPSNEVY